MADDVDRYPAGVPCWIDLAHPDRAAAADFYGALFGWGFTDAPDGLLAHLEGRPVAGIGTGSSGVWRTWIRVNSADAAATAVRGAGGRVLAEPADVPGVARV